MEVGCILFVFESAHRSPRGRTVAAAQCSAIALSLSAFTNHSVRRDFSPLSCIHVVIHVSTETQIHVVPYPLKSTTVIVA